ncbi:MAG: hypothetical protein A2879_00815 [Omnitrophica WOR_2 bacterium RIFCSPHIGHO2_01_FULL_49_10]|nr:MAG: hypothetical protein A2879_00815 [Omnitrophica WOR_2 bacterium RIFCSPHIGHO2_01_FULL_49_10]
MANDIKSGREILNIFFSEINSLKVPDKEAVAVIARLFKEGKLSDINVSNELAELRKRKQNDKDK